MHPKERDRRFVPQTLVPHDLADFAGIGDTGDDLVSRYKATRCHLTSRPVLEYLDSLRTRDHRERDR